MFNVVLAATTSVGQERFIIFSTESQSSTSYLSSNSPGSHYTGFFALSIRHVSNIFTINSLIKVFVGEVSFALV